MNINEKVLNRVRGTAKIGDEKVLACMKIGHHVKGHFIRSCFLATEFEVMILEKVKHDGNLRVVERFFWDEIASLSIPDETHITISTDKTSVEVKLENAFAVANDIYSCVISLNQSCHVDAPSGKIKAHNSLSLSGLKRFSMNLFKNGISAPSSLLSGIEMAIRQKQDALDLHKLRCSDKYLKELLSVIETMNCFTRIILPSSDNSTNWDIISQFLQNTKNIESVAFTEIINKNSSKCVEALKSNRSEKLKELVFVKSDINKNNFKQFLEFLAPKKVHRIVFDKAIDPSFYSEFFSEIAMSSDAMSVDSVSFKNMNGLPAEMAMASFKHASSFEFIKCNTEVDKIVPFFNQSILKSIIVDGGTIVNGKQIDNTEFSNGLSSLTFSHCKWERYSFISMWCKILNIKPDGYPIKMDVSYAQANAVAMWQQFFQAYCALPTKSIESINWSGNPVHDQFMRFLAGCQNLTYIGLDDCFTAQTTDVMLNFADYLKEKTSSTSLSLCSNEAGAADSNLAFFLERLSNYQQLKNLNISGQIIDDNIIQMLIKLLAKNKKLEKLQFDGNIEASYESLSNFYGSVQQRGIKIDLEWPFQSIAKFRAKNAISVPLINKLRLSFKQACNGGRAVEPLTDIEEECSSYIQEELLNSAFEEYDNNPIWNISLPEIPEPDNESILQSAASKYNLSNLLTYLRQSE